MKPFLQTEFQTRFFNFDYSTSVKPRPSAE